MISLLASPSVFVIDNEPEDYQPILDALNALFVSCIHIKGDDIEQLPDQPFSGVKLVFQDLHLTADTGKNAASHAANVFRRLVSPETAPVIVVVWSKYAADTVTNAAAPEEDEKTEYQLFRETLLKAVPEFSERLIFVEMPKKKREERPEGATWIGEIKDEIAEALKNKEAVEALWQWESLVQLSGTSICKDITSLAHEASRTSDAKLEDGLKAAMQFVVRAQSEGDLSVATAPQHLASALSLLHLDYLEGAGDAQVLLGHGTWLAQEPEVAVKDAIRAKLNALLLTANLADGMRPFLPGVICKVVGQDSFSAAFGRSLTALVDDCFKGNGAKRQAWEQGVKPVVIEISPTCDVAQGKRHRALVLGGLIVPVAVSECVKKGDAWRSVQLFRLRWGRDDFAAQDASLVFCSRYRATLPADTVPAWLSPWFRLRDLPTSDLRNWHSAMAARVGYLSV